MKKILVMEYNEDLLRSLKGQRVVVQINTLEQLESRYSESQRNNEVVAMCVRLPFTSISQIDFKQDWSQIPLIIYAFNIGNYDSFFRKVNLIRSLDLRIYLSNESETSYTDLKVMSSLGVDCGLYMAPGKKMSDDSFLDLASYYFMSPVPHATIEPFEHILRHLDVEKSEGFKSVFFEDPLKFTLISSLDIFDECEHNNIDNDFAIKIKEHYQHFIDLDECAKCPAFKICDKQMFQKLNECQKTMNEVYEYAELRNSINSKQETKIICQL